MIYEAHCLTCDTVTIIYSDEVLPRSDATIAKVQHNNRQTGQKCDKECIFCLTDDME